MAFHILGQDYQEFAIDESVGRSIDGQYGVNRKDDVMLVQWIMNRTLTDKDYLGQRLVVDGIFGPSTDYLICRFLFKQRDRHLMSYNEKFGTLLTAPVWTGNNSVNASMATILFDHARFRSAELPSLLATMPALLQRALKNNPWSFHHQGPKSKPFPR